MVHNLLIVESPSKIKTIEKFLASLASQLNLGTFTVMASYGHIRDLEKKALGIDVDHGFAPQYAPIHEKLKTIKAIQAKLKTADMVWLATDLDREGEAISWHLQQIMGLRPKQYKRITFNEITKNALEKALQHPRTLDLNLVNAQQTRRVVDRVVGFKLTELLWSVFSSNHVLSAGRVQSAVMDLICVREEEAQAFESSPYWHVHGDFKIKIPGAKAFVIEDATLCDANEEQTRLLSTEAVQAFMHTLKPPFNLHGSTITQTHTKPERPYITSSLQQDAYSKCGMGINRTMKLAQDLYEGGHITYMRTDSYHLSDAFVRSAHNYIQATYGQQYVGSFKDQKKQRTAKNAQEAHEAIRPTYIDKLVDDINMSVDHKKLYDLIWRRACAACMASAVFDQMVVQIKGPCLQTKYFKGSLTHMVFDGFLKISVKSKKAQGEEAEAEAEAVVVQDLHALHGKLQDPGVSIDCKKINTQNTWTIPPARYAESTLVKKMEKDGLGRPSTYGSILKKLFDKQYIQTNNYQGEEKTYVHYVWMPKKGITSSSETKHYYNEKNKLSPTPLGLEINGFLRKAFPLMVSTEFTSNMENQLDTIAAGNLAYEDFMGQFYHPFMEMITTVKVPKKKRDMTQTNQHVLSMDGVEYTIRQAKYGPVVMYDGGEADKKRYINLKPYLQYMSKTMADIDVDDVKLLLSFPQTVKGSLQLLYGQYGFYLSDGEKNKRLYPNQKEWVCDVKGHKKDIGTWWANSSSLRDSQRLQLKLTRLAANAKF